MSDTLYVSDAGGGVTQMTSDDTGSMYKPVSDIQARLGKVLYILPPISCLENLLPPHSAFRKGHVQCLSRSFMFRHLRRRFGRPIYIFIYRQQELFKCQKPNNPPFLAPRPLKRNNRMDTNSKIGAGVSRLCFFCHITDRDDHSNGVVALLPHVVSVFVVIDHHVNYASDG